MLKQKRIMGFVTGLYLMLIESGDYMAFGLSGSDTSTNMFNADVTVTWLDTSAHAVDYRLTQYSQVRRLVILLHVGEFNMVSGEVKSKKTYPFLVT